MTWLARYLRSSIGAKHVMAVTGLLLLLFALAHMAGHMLMFGGRELYDGYAHTLQSLWPVKWPVRVGLIVLVAIHVMVGLALVAKNRAARPVAYAVYRPVLSSTVGRTMALSGLVVLAFLVFHIVHFTLGEVQPQYFHMLDPDRRYDAYSMFVRGFQNPAIYVSYLVGIGLLASHLGHGASSWLQSLGVRHPKYPTDPIGRIVGFGLFLGYMTPPTAVLVGFLKLPGA